MAGEGECAAGNNECLFPFLGMLMKSDFFSIGRKLVKIV